ESAIAINPKAAGTFVLQGIYQYGAKQYPLAIKSLGYALELQPNSVNANYNLALTYLETKQFELANVHAQRAYALGATYPGLRNRLTQLGYWKPSEAGSTPPGDAKAAAPGTGAAPGTSSGGK